MCASAHNLWSVGHRPSRTLIERYRQLNESVERLVTRINDRFGQATYRAIILHRAHHEPPTVFRYYRAADLCYVSNLHDGMNLVAKEFVAARDDEHGVLVLSQFTGAARELTEALIVNPYDMEEASAAMHMACAGQWIPPVEEKFGGPKLDQAKRLKELERENSKPKSGLARIRCSASEPGSTWGNGYCESFNGKLRDECLNGEIFYSLKDRIEMHGKSPVQRK
jgi:Glycosyltransferase family 20/Integrase core domain